ncbi:hypothetical protein [Methylobacterium oryzihabitans]|uniref:Uncharacterized protein n=1 Tax=Methylobacterium oryzihabitans TaxID=2499852 RepID=A0A3S2YL61_9HYPH|nr:hypothetical protein [Methylobacterium oryzihabitans]RVU14031.1 hypothetical protein EOE48_25205 [Methylobacterium oryzihabitans]
METLSNGLGALLGAASVFVKHAFFPSDVNQMTVFYLIWIGLFFIINTVWDIVTDKTPAFHIATMKDKMDVLYGASTFCSSLLILIGLVSPEVGKLSKDTILPLVLAGGAGILRGLPALCPYKPEIERKPGESAADGKPQPPSLQPPPVVP